MRIGPGPVALMFDATSGLAGAQVPSRPRQFQPRRRRLVPAVASHGRVVSLIKHSHKNIDIGRPGKDSYRLRESGNKEVLLLGNEL